MKKRKIMKWLNNIVTSIFLVLLIGVALLVLSTKLSGENPEVLGYQLKTVLSGSMEPGIQTGSVIAVKTVTDGLGFKKGDVITFMEEEDKLITHRITEVSNTSDGVLYTTKGDNNNAVDRNPVLADNVVGVYSGFTIPFVGYLVNFSQSQNGSIVFLILPGVMMLGYAAFTIWRALKELEDKDKTKTAEIK